MPNVWHFALGFVVVAAVIAALMAADRAKRTDQKCPAKPSEPTNNSTGTMASENNIGAGVGAVPGGALPADLRQDGYYRTVNDVFYGEVPNSQAKPDISPNEETLDQIRREYYHYRERISNRNNLNSYVFPNKLGWYPRATYGNVRLEPGQWPKYDNPPFSVAWRSGIRACGPDNPSTFGGPDNSGTVVNSFGRLIRRGMCVNGVADCPVGMTSAGGTCIGEAARDAFGSLVWSRTEFSPTLSDVADVYTAEQLEGNELGTPTGFY